MDRAVWLGRTVRQGQKGMAGMAKYSFKEGSPISNFGVSAEDAGRTIEAIAARNGGQAKPEMLVDVARRVSHPLHHYFEWDDATAGEHYRVMQARALIRSVVIHVSNEPTRVIRAFVSVNPGKGYELIGDVMSDVDKRAKLLSRALIELDQMQARYSDLRELAKVWEAAARVKKKRKVA